MFLSKFSTIIVLFLFYTAFAENDFYWEKYDPVSNQSISSEAFVAGQDANQRNIYIGRCLIKGFRGMPIVGVLPGEQVWVAFNGLFRVTTEVLCSKNAAKFQWVSAFNGAKARDLPVRTSDSFALIRGGVQSKPGSDDFLITYIGRTKRQGSDVIGMVTSHDTFTKYTSDVFIMKYNTPDKGILLAEKYEVLVISYE